MDMIVGERGVDVGGQIACTKHVSGLVSKMLPCGAKYSKRLKKVWFWVCGLTLFFFPGAHHVIWRGSSFLLAASPFHGTVSSNFFCFLISHL